MTYRTGNNGFTLVELCVTGMVLSLLLAFAWPSLSAVLSRTELETVCGRIGHTLTAVRDTALRDGRRYSVEFDTGRGSCSILEESGDTFRPAVRFLSSGRFIGGDVRLERAEPSKLVIEPDGTSADLVLRFSRGGRDGRTLRYKGLTGRVYVEPYAYACGS